MGSRSEGFSGPVLEAMACGCAVVATDCGGPKDIITDGVNGFLVPVGDASALLERVEYLLDNVAARERIRAAGLQTAAQFTWDKCIEKFDNALHLAMEEHACRSYTLPGEH